MFTIRLPPPGGPTAKAEMRPETQAVPRGLAPPPVSGEGLSLGRAARPQGLAVKGALFSVLGQVSSAFPWAAKAGHQHPSMDGSHISAVWGWYVRAALLALPLPPFGGGDICRDS